jgi:hypothetical protein
MTSTLSNISTATRRGMASSLPKVPAARPTDSTSVYRKPAADAMLVRQANHVGKREVLVPER